MSATLTKIKGLFPTALGYEGIFNVSMAGDSSFAAGGEALDFTSYFSAIYSAEVASVDAVGDALYKFDVKIPTSGTAVAADNVLLVASQVPALDGNAAATQAFAASDTVDLSGVTQLRLRVVGKASF